MISLRIQQPSLVSCHPNARDTRARNAFQSVLVAHLPHSHMSSEYVHETRFVSVQSVGYALADTQCGAILLRIQHPFLIPSILPHMLLVLRVDLVRIEHTFCLTIC